MPRREPLTQTNIEARWIGLSCDIETRALVVPVSDEMRHELAALARIKDEQDARMLLRDLTSVATNYQLTILADDQERPTRKAEAFERIAKRSNDLAEKLERLPEFTSWRDELSKAPPEIRTDLFRPSVPLDEVTACAFTPVALRKLAEQARKRAAYWNARVEPHRSKLPGERYRALARDLQTVACQHSGHLRNDWGALRAWLVVALKAFEGEPPTANKADFDKLMLPKAADGSVELPRGESLPHPHKKDFPRSERAGRRENKLRRAKF